MRLEWLSSRSFFMEARRTRAMLRHYVPPHVIARMQHGDTLDVNDETNVTLLFCDVLDFPFHVTQHSPREMAHLLHCIDAVFDALCLKHNVRKMDMNGSTFYACAGLERSMNCRCDSNDTHHAHAQNAHRDSRRSQAPALRMMHLALDMRHIITTCNNVNRCAHMSLNVRMGIHTGCVSSSMLGRTKPHFALFGDTLHRAARLHTRGVAGQILLSRATYDHVKHHGFIFHEQVTSIEARTTDRNMTTNTTTLTPVSPVYVLVSQASSSRPRPQRSTLSKACEAHETRRGMHTTIKTCDRSFYHRWYV
jgi:class 3 adenylate cyclase